MRGGANTGAVILAAGGSSRLGRPKQMLVYEGRALVRRTAEAAESAGLHPIVAVAGDDFPRIRAVLKGTSAFLFHHPEWQRGIGSSIRLGLERLTSLSPRAEAAVLLTCDQPFVTPSLLERLVGAWKTGPMSAAACSYADTVGVPAIFGSTLFPKLLALEDTHGAKALLTALRERLATVSFPQGSVDIDSPKDWYSFSQQAL